jgi:hypothetical protein
MKRLACALALAVGLASTPAAAAQPPQDPAGEFRGVIHVRKWTYDVGLRVRRTPDGYAASYDWITLDIWDIPMQGVAARAGPAFERKAPQGTFVARFDPRTGWRGEWRRWGEVFPMQFRRAPLPPAPLLPRPDRNALIILGGLVLAESAGIARLLQLRRRRKRRRAAV